MYFKVDFDANQPFYEVADKLSCSKYVRFEFESGNMALISEGAVTGALAGDVIFFPKAAAFSKQLLFRGFITMSSISAEFNSINDILNINGMSFEDFIASKGLEPITKEQFWDLTTTINK